MPYAGITSWYGVYLIVFNLGLYSASYALSKYHSSMCQDLTKTLFVSSTVYFTSFIDLSSIYTLCDIDATFKFGAGKISATSPLTD